MSLWNTIIIAFIALKRNPTRALLTTLGIMIGIASVITMMEIGRGSSNSIRNSIEKMGANSVTIMPGWVRVGGISRGASTRVSLMPSDAEAIGRECPSVAYFSPLVWANGNQVIYGSNNWVPNRIIGAAPDYMKIVNWQIAEGRNFTERELEHRVSVCLVGSTVVRELFDGKSPVDCEMRIRNTTFKVIGVLHSKGSSMNGSDQDDIIIAPWTTVRMRLTGLRSGSATSTKSTAAARPGELYPGTGVALYPEPDSNLSSDTLLVPRFTYIDQIVFAAVSPDKVQQAVKEAALVLRERHNLKPDQDDDFRIFNSAEFMAMLSSTSVIMTNLLLIVALISLLVGGVGIMNIMLVSVTERTREIGLRMAVGARSSDILKQFLVEAIVLCLVGGIIGIIMGHGAALMVETYLKWPIESSPGAVAAAFCVSVAVGIIFGFYPAYKASKLDPIDALRYE
jgi:ABC-type antimicrobial peptide transport system permease subunit